MIDPFPIVARSKSVSEALTSLSVAIAPDGGHALSYGFYAHIHSRARNDFVIDFSHRDALEGLDPEEIFRTSGGTATDIVATNLESNQSAYSIDIPDIAKRMQSSRDGRLTWVSFILEMGFQTAWIGAINAPWVGGYGVLNHFLPDRHASAPIPSNDLIPLAHQFHDAINKAGLLTKSVGLTNREVATLHLAAQGRTAEEIALKDNVTTQAVEQRLKRARRKLRARNGSEAIYKALTYGILPNKGR